MASVMIMQTSATVPRKIRKEGIFNNICMRISFYEHSQLRMDKFLEHEIGFFSLSCVWVTQQSPLARTDSGSWYGDAAITGTGVLLIAVRRCGCARCRTLVVSWSRSSSLPCCTTHPATQTDSPGGNTGLGRSLMSTIGPHPSCASRRHLVVIEASMSQLRSSGTVFRDICACPPRPNKFFFEVT